MSKRPRWGKVALVGLIFLIAYNQIALLNMAEWKNILYICILLVLYNLAIYGRWSDE